MTYTTADTNAQMSTNYRAAADERQITVYTLDTPYGMVNLTLHGTTHQNHLHGDIWTPDPITINRIEHELIGHWRLAMQHMEWPKSGPAVQVNRPYLVISGFPGLRRWGGGDITDNARTKLCEALGAAIAADFDTPHYHREALANERKIAAQDLIRKADTLHRDADRARKDAKKLEDKAAAIMAGGDYEKPKP